MDRAGLSACNAQAGEILFIDARNLGHLINRRTKEFTDEDITKIFSTYHEWRKQDLSACGSPAQAGGDYKDIPAFCASTPIEKVRELDYVLSPGRYVGLPTDSRKFKPD